MSSIILIKYEKTKTKNGIESDKKRQEKTRFATSLWLKEYQFLMHEFSYALLILLLYTCITEKRAPHKTVCRNCVLYCVP